MNKFRIVFKNAKSQSESVTYSLADHIVAEKWIKKIKHLQKVAPSKTFTPGRPIINLVERHQSYADNLKKLHQEYCRFAGIDYVELNYHDKTALNQLDEIYETHFERLSSQRNNDIIYQFGSAISVNRKYDKNGGDCLGCSRCINCLYHVGWGPQEGLLEEEFTCNSYYADSMLKNNIYLTHGGTGKTPLKHFLDKKPFNIESISPHTRLKASFAICQVEKNIETLSEDFENWFQPFKDTWLNHYNIKDWQARDEHSAVLLAECDDHSIDIASFIDAYPFFDSISIL
jgi:hypothetical protein